MRYDRDSNQRRTLPGAGVVEDYTNAFLVSFGMVIFVGLFALVALIGFAGTVASALVVERLFMRGKSS